MGLILHFLNEKKFGVLVTVEAFKLNRGTKWSSKTTFMVDRFAKIDHSCGPMVIIIGILLY